MAELQTRVLQVLRAQKKVPIGRRDLAKRAGVRKDDREEFERVLQQLTQANRLVEKNGKFLLADHLGLVGAKIAKVTGTFGFATPDGWDKDVFIAGRKLAGAMPGDRVLIKVMRGSGELPEGEVYQITEAAALRFSGVVEQSPDGGANVLPDRYVKFPIRLSGSLLGAKDGDKILCELVRRGDRHGGHLAHIVQVFGSSESAAACCAAILAANGIATEFPPEVREQAQAIAAGSGIHPKELAARLDLRDELIFTIDGADSKDLDDAVSLRKHSNGWELGVHIADVSYYVTHQSPLDQEAMRRGTSVYYADSVVPMLPEELSNGICSLNPGEDRLAFSALMQLDPHGKLKTFEFRKTVIRSRVKGIYSEINAILDGSAGPAVLCKYEELIPTIHLMRELADLLRRARWARGGINLESVESKIIVGEDGCAVDVRPRERGVSEGIIEELMLTANEAAATRALELELPFVFRVHDNPAPDRIDQLYAVLDQLGLPIRRPKGNISSEQLAQVLEQVRGKPMQQIVNTMVLRSMAKAKYSERCTGHFGLALHNYTHFTSPIRRYPDLTIHRILSGQVTGMKRVNIERRFQKFVAESAAKSTEREIAAMTAERDCEDCYKAEFMRGLIGEQLEGVISSITPFGIYVQLPNTVEGLVHISRFPPGEWQADSALSFTERRTGGKLRLGDRVRIVVAGVSVSTGTIDFALS